MGSVVWPQLQVDWFTDVNRFSGETPWLHAPLRLFTEYGVVLFAALLVLSWWLARGERDLSRTAITLWAPVGALLAIGVNQLVAGDVAEPRPYAVLPHVLLLVPRTQDYAFPSDHAVLAGAVAAGVVLAHRRLGLVAVALACLMAFSRVYVGAHFPLDVLAGLAFGAAVVGTTYLLTRPLVRPAVAWLARTPLRPLVTAAPGAAR
ncbi:phosphatase PAP2 family protein [Nocardioides sp. T2.26MG-1]|uniref:phosphatase PAP2 family protein n=1 Tax=Nocardioides sp. T2.26MG-1 TaxID=3041166 RepID=UPI002477AED5|nr:phosphatase PAP2 family protein [Nocardioides sp. T2.26MG-1]CAI9404146.1 Undecaprenyl-diphosphatase BcrC [Nocardioides sp. T2.26MG-1]